MNGKKILIVDDEEIVRFAFTEALRERGFMITEASDGTAAVELFNKERFDAVLLDLKMPGIDGIETMKRLKKIDAETPVVIITAFGDIPTAVGAIKLGAYDFVEKPPQISKLLSTLKNIVDFRIETAAAALSPKILLADDDPFVRDMLADVLIDKGYLVESAENGRDALEKFNADPAVNLVLTDINMPVMNGLELLKELRGNNFDVPIIVLSGNKEIDVVMEALNSGADEYLLKDELIQDTIDITVKKTLEKQQLKKRNLQLIADLSMKTTELENTLSYLTAIINNMPDGLLVTNADGVITLANPAIGKMFDLRGMNLNGRNCVDIFNEQMSGLMERSRLNREEFLTSDITLSDDRIGRAVAVSILRKKSSGDATDDFIGSLMIVRDITYEKEIEQMKDDFISTVSHELRTPLTSILGFARLIKGKLESVIFPAVTDRNGKVQRSIGQVQENMNIIVVEGERLTTLINDVLDLAKMEAGKTDWREEPLSVADIIDRATSATASLFTHKDLRLIKEIDGDMPPATGDRDRLIQVVINLISNAVKFTEQGSVTVRAVRAGSAEARKHGTPEDQTRAGFEGDFIKISVTDTGIGISTEDQPKVFEKFKQVGSTLTDRPKGTGLGLPICKQIVDHHGGSIWVESEPGKGCTLAFTLPSNK